jgi:hypothetical protein
MASTYLTRTPSGAGTNSKIFTLSLWIKRCGLGASQSMMGTGNSSGYSSVFLEFDSSDRLRFAQINALGASPQFEFEYVTNRVFRDVNAWYHIVCTVDSTDSTAANRVKIYVNGVRETSFSITNHAGLNTTFLWNDARVHSIGRHGEWNLRYQNGVMSHIHNIDGTAYDATAFGEYDANGVWKIKTSPSVTYGTNGFFILKDGNSVTDQSPNTNNFTVGGGTLTKTEDSPSNVFATLNPLALSGQTSSFSNGNTKAQTATAVASNQVSTLAASSGKYYWEIKCDAISSDEDPFIFGIMEVQSYPTSRFSVLSTGYGYRGFTGQKVNTNVSSSYGDAYAVGDIISVAVDLDNNKIYFAKNGTWQNSGVPTSGATGTGAAFTINDGTYFAAQCCEGNTRNVTYSTNFGNGYFGTTAVSSAQNPDDGIGIFEYDVPAGYKALCTKSINAQEYD